MSTGIALVLVAALGFGAVACSSDKKSSDKSKTTQKPALQTTASKPITKVLDPDPQFDSFADLLKRSKVDRELARGGPYTLLVPNSAAFSGMPQDELKTLNDDPTGAGAELLKRHVVKGRLHMFDLQKLAGKTVTTIGGTVLPVTVDENHVVAVGGIKLAKTDIDAKDGVIHVLDSVIPVPA